jgi:uncharacterized protein (DUF1778 family)
MSNTKKTRMGRPPKSGSKSMGERLEIRLLPGEKDAYDAAADAAGMERSEWIRLVLNGAAEAVLQAKRSRVQ